MAEHFRCWQPLRDPGYGVGVVKEWQYMLGDPNHVYVQGHNNMDVYQRLIWDVWLPHVRTAILYVDSTGCLL